MSLVEPVNLDERGMGAEITPPTRYILPKAPLRSISNNSLALPASVDHSSKLPPVGNQGNAGSCVGWASSYYYKTFQEGVDQGWDVSTNSHQFSPNFVWNQIQIYSSCSGTYPASALELITNKGDLPLSSMPYSEDCKLQPTAAQLDIAANYRAENYGSFFTYGTPPSDAVITQMKEWLAGGDIIMLAIPVMPEFDNPSGPYCIVDLPNQGASRGGHAITIVGYNDNIGGLGKQGFKIVNSWGTEYGCSGFAYITYDWIKQYANEAWWMRDINGGSPSNTRDFTIFNDGQSTLTVSDVSKQGSSAWLELSLPEGLPMLIEPGESATIKLTINSGGLSDGSYTEKVLVQSDDADEPTSEVTVTLNVGSTSGSAPAQASSPLPANTATGQNAIDLKLNWSMSGSTAGVMYDVRLDTANPPATVVCNDITKRSCQVASLRPNTTYYWRVVSLNTTYSTVGPVWSLTTGVGSSVYLPGLLKR